MLFYLNVGVLRCKFGFHGYKNGTRQRMGLDGSLGVFYGSISSDR